MGRPSRPKGTSAATAASRSPQLLEDEVYLSNFNQMFLLGKYDPDLFEETMNAFPMSRLYRFKFPPEPAD